MLLIDLILLGFLFPGRVLSPLEGDLLLRVYEQQSLWMGGKSEICMQLVIYLQNISVYYVFVWNYM
jgi:hypothetical protein